ncbi:hypothetical protein FRC03_011971 [Tulasnella sp. 419]|nr:hypothetical protein FRC03_011971 [Tulasnella sp. 419]
MITDFQTAVKQEEERLSVLHPTSDDIPSCTRLLDDFFLCYAVGSQMKSIYRYGQAAECRAKFEDFKFCLSNKTLSQEEKRNAWIHRRAEWWASRRINGSSEDVWDLRTASLKDFPPRTASEAYTEEGSSHVNEVANSNPSK